MDQPKIVRLEPDAAFLAFLTESSQRVAAMPQWRQGNLAASSRSTTRFPRPPIVTEESEARPPQEGRSDE